MKFFTDKMARIVLVVLLLVGSFLYHGVNLSSGMFFVNVFVWYMLGLWHGYKH
jgi:hypothetical protein